MTDPPGYEPGTLEAAWDEYRDADRLHNTPDQWAAFRAGYRRGFGQGAHLAATTFVCTRDTP
jgi:hypothetical protein